MKITAKADYAVRAALELAASAEGAPIKGPSLAEAQNIPQQFLEQILHDLKRAGLVKTKRGASGGYWLALPAAEINLADVIRAVEGPLANIHDQSPEETDYSGAAARLSEVWIAIRAALRTVLEEVTLAELAAGELPPAVAEMIGDAEAWETRDTSSHPIIG